MAVKRIVANISGADLEAAKSFYRDVLDMEVVMDHGWIMTFAGTAQAAPQLSVAIEGGAGTPVPAISIEVDDLEDTYRRVLAASLPVEYGPVLEPWGVRRFFTRDPSGTLLNILAHDRPDAGEPKE